VAGVKTIAFNIYKLSAGVTSGGFKGVWTNLVLNNVLRLFYPNYKVYINWGWLPVLIVGHKVSLN